MSYDDLVESYLVDLFTADPHTGKRLLGDILEMDYKNARKWQWIVAFIECKSTEEKRRCIEEEVRQNPGNQIAKKALAIFNSKFQ